MATASKAAVKSAAQYAAERDHATAQPQARSNGAAAAGTGRAARAKQQPEAAPTKAPTKARRAANGAAAPAARKRARSADADADVAPADDVVDPRSAPKSRAGRGATPREAAVPVQIGGLMATATRPEYWDHACAELVRSDRIMKKLIPQFGPVHLVTRGDPFVTLARSIVGQQISVKAAQAVWDRVEGACKKLSPSQFVKVGADRLLDCGLSKRKCEYILDLAEHFVSGALHVDTWASMDDEAVIAELTQIRGIGRWTAEMFLIFNLLRPDVLPLDDLGLIRAISVNYFSGEPVTRSEAREVAANWEPWRTVATWYMWRSLDPLPVEY